MLVPLGMNVWGLDPDEIGRCMVNHLKCGLVDAWENGRMEE